MGVEKMGFVNNVLDWASDKVQSFTGEKERREYVDEIKTTYDGFKEQITENVESVNDSIRELNVSIKELNEFRLRNISQNIECLGDFLSHFGNVKAIGSYVEEESACCLEIPEHRFLCIEDYITEIDWSKEEVFVNGFFLGPLGMKKKTQAQNLSMQEQLNSLKLEAEQTIIVLKNLKFDAEQDIKIAELYIYCVERIIIYIEHVIVPELDVIEAFFQALALKNRVIVDSSIEDITFKNNIELLKDTQYQGHYMFIKNAYMFYIIACKIYNTPVLSKLLKGDSTGEDFDEITREKQLLENQMINVERFLVFERREA